MANETKSIDAAGGYGNLVLYRMCSEKPLHVEREIVASKARTIAKVYDVSRNLGNDYQLIAKVLCSEKLNIDSALAKFDNMEFSERTLPQVVQLHSWLDRALCKKLQKKGGKRQVHSRASFVSKYLHFHRPCIFPILDSLAERAAKGRIGRLPVATPSDFEVNPRYERFCRAILQLKRSPEFDGKSLRAIDRILLNLSDA